MTILNELREADQSWNVAVIAPAIAKIMQESPQLTLLDVEDAFRAIESKTTYLVAWPLALIPATMTPKKLDWRTPAQYGLYICINGQQDMLDQLSAFGLTIEQNREALRECGFLTAVEAR